MLTAAAVLAPPAAAHGQPPRPTDGASFDDWIVEAARRFAVPSTWIRNVMRVESGLKPQAVSRAGAIGLMQIMPRTYAELRTRYGLGADPFHPHDNILAGAAYLRELYDRYGAGGFLAAYNAGPARYEQHLIDGRPLPAETRAYVASLTRITGRDPGGSEPPAAAPPPRPSIFAPIGVALTTPGIAPTSAADRLFVVLTPSLEVR